MPRVAWASITCRAMRLAGRNGWRWRPSGSAGRDSNPRQQRYQQQRHDIDDLDQRVDGRAGGILVGIADRIAGDGRFVRLRALATIVAFLDVLLGIVPG